MARIVFTVETYPRKQAQNSTAGKRVFSHGPPRPFHAARKGKGGQEVRPPFYTVGSRMPNVSLSEDATARGKRRALLNIVADAATRHGITIPGAIVFNLPQTVEAQREDLLREIRRKDAREEAQLLAEQERAALRHKAETSKPLTVCGKCAKVIAALFPSDAWRWHAENCPERTKAWQEAVARNEWAKRAWKLRKDIAPPADASAPKEEAELTKTDLAGAFDASADAVAASKTDRTQYINAGDYSDQHK